MNSSFTPFYKSLAALPGWAEMTARQKRDSRAAGKVSSDLGPVAPHSSQSLYTSRAHKSESLPSIAGIGLGNEDVRSVSSVPVTKATKSFITIVKPEKPGKSAVSKAVQQVPTACPLKTPTYLFRAAPVLQSASAVSIFWSLHYRSGNVSSNEEHLLLSKIEALEKEICLLKSSLKEKDNLITELNEIMKTKTMQFTRDMENEINDHKATRQTLERSQRIVEEKEQLLTESIQRHEKVQQDLQDQYEDTLASVREQTQKEVNIRDERINKLKQQISELFKDKSWEHKKQIEELQKELKRLAEEAHVLRGQLKRHSVSTHECEKCKSLMSALEDSRLQLKLKNRTIEELQSMCQRFQHQLQEQVCHLN